MLSIIWQWLIVIDKSTLVYMIP